MPLKILIADDHPAITLAVRSQLRSQTGWEVCADVHSSAEPAAGRARIPA